LIWINDGWPAPKTFRRSLGVGRDEYSTNIHRIAAISTTNSLHSLPKVVLSAAIAALGLVNSLEAIRPV
jgi:hypothetical protein